MSAPQSARASGEVCDWRRRRDGAGARARPRMRGRSAAAAAAAAACLWACALGAAPASAATPDAPPDIILIISDDHSAVDIGAYYADIAGTAHDYAAGRSRARTPTLDALAASGVRFTRASTPTPLCNPSRASLLSGRYPSAHGVTENHAVVRDGVALLPALLTARGYHTALLGKDEVLGHRTALTTCGEREEELNVSAADSACGDAWPREWPTPWMRTQRAGYFRKDGVLFDEWCRDCRAQLADGGTLACGACVEGLRADVEAALTFRDDFHPGQPMLLIVALTEPHAPYPDYAQSGYTDESALNAALPAAYEAAAAAAAEAAAAGNPGALANESAAFFAAARREAAGYNAAVERTDALVGAVLDAHAAHVGAASARFANTLTLFTADHGAGKLVTAKASLYAHGARVPLLARWPARLAPGGVSGALVCFTDVAPTLLELAGYADDEVAAMGLAGTSLTGTVLEACAPGAPGVTDEGEGENAGEGEGADRIAADGSGASCARAEHRARAYGWWPAERPLDTNVRQGCYPMRSVHTARWKLIANLNNAKQLVHLAYTVEGHLNPEREAWRWYVDNMPHYALRPRFELYDLEADPEELADVASSHPDVVEELAAHLAAWMDSEDDAACGGADCAGEDGATCCELDAAAAARSGAPVCSEDCPEECLTCGEGGACASCAYRRCLRLISNGDKFSVQGIQDAAAGEGGGEGGVCARSPAEVLTLLRADARNGTCVPDWLPERTRDGGDEEGEASAAPPPMGARAPAPAAAAAAAAAATTAAALAEGQEEEEEEEEEVEEEEVEERKEEKKEEEVSAAPPQDARARLAAALAATTAVAAVAVAAALALAAA